MISNSAALQRRIKLLEDERIRCDDRHRGNMVKVKSEFFITDTGENVQKWTRVFSTRR